MKNLALALVVLFLFGNAVFSQSIPPDSLYFGQTPPGDSAIIFAPGLISLPGRNEPCITFSPDGKSAFFNIEFYPDPTKLPFIMFTEYENDHWTAPDTIPFAVGRGTGEPFFAFTNNRLYMFATNAINAQGIADISYSGKQGNIWSNPISLGNPPNSESYQYHPCIVGDTSLYFSSSAGYICRSQYTNGVYQTRVILPNPINYIGSQTWGDPYVSPDESYMILKSIRTGGYGQNDIYIAYKKIDGTWTNPKNLGNKINTQYDETSGDITPDGKYMTFGSNKDIHWVRSNFIDSLKYTNFVPYVKNSIPDQTVTVGQSFNYTISDSTFFDDDGSNTLTYGAKLANGNPLPAWLTFDTITRTFDGVPTIVQTLLFRVTATDTAGATASSILKIKVNPLTAINQIEKQGARIFPNPTSGLINISLDTLSDKTTIVEISNLKGQVILTNTFKNNIRIDLADKPKGIYITKLFIDNETIIGKICIE
ncbi:MAG: putative Ig domain-containing protein [Lentimicrobiaceae bacterium]|nr:putative Ig domain-containing protein [Lentimicrobiaceae bacterium]